MRRPEQLVQLEFRRKRFRKRPKRLQQQLFMSFGVAIFATMFTSGMLAQALRVAMDHKPWLRLIIFLVAGSVLWTLSGIFARRLAWPLWELARAVKDFGRGDLSRRAYVTRRAPSEVSDVAALFNDMAARIETQVRTQRELLGAVSHELRTPLARLRVLLAMLQDRGTEPELVAKFEREVLEMDTLVGELLAEARISAEAITKRPLDLGDLVRECIERLGLEGTQVTIDPSCRALSADPTLLSRALTILLDNARKHAGDAVCVRAERSGSSIRIAVEDAGPGLDPNDVQRLFEPFTRGRAANSDGVGLGLYLVRRIAEAHGGQAFAENRSPTGACVGFTLATA
ncbi:MAG TPA: HAMP domain-containing sensor histidine kinase [Polyangiales bacterium]|nr:HAMP domain-containing sensor histidine kinase [Polyangiales bacterium]